MGRVGQAFYESVLRGIGAGPTTENLRACLAWQGAEGGSAAWNPWNTTQPEHGDSFYNTFGAGYHVRNYPDEPTGVRATVATLTNGHYDAIVERFRAGHDGLAVCRAVDASVWGTHGAARAFLARYGSAAPSPRLLGLRSPMLHGSDVRRVQEALQRHGYVHLNADGWFGRLTDHAVRGFQAADHLGVDGIVGPRTRHALGLAA